MLGASGILVGKWLWATSEVLGHDNVKDLLNRSSGDTILRTGIFDIIQELDWPPGYSGRALANEFSVRCHGNEEKLVSTLSPEKERFWTAMREGMSRLSWSSQAKVLNW
jgi:nitronate monooxygenase